MQISKVTNGKKNSRHRITHHLVFFLGGGGVCVFVFFNACILAVANLV